VSRLEDQDSVRVWMEAAGMADGDERLEVLVDFCDSVDRNPDELVMACLKEVKEGQFKIRHKALREVAAAVDQFQHDVGDQRTANYVRSFLIHNGVNLQAPGILR
jgi:hypothetical protein